MFESIGEGCYIEPPLHANWAGKHVFMGDYVYANFNLTLVDDDNIFIGDNSVIGAGSIVTRNIPANVVAVGNPCRAMREIGSHDRKFFYRDEKIDWENLT